MKTKFLPVYVFLAIFFANVFVFNNTAHAVVSGTCFFTSGSCSAAPDYLTNDLFKGRAADGSGSAIDTTQLKIGNNLTDLADNKNYFLNFINNRFSGADVQDKTGAAYIMQKMLGTNVAKSSTDNVEWINRMNQPEITVVFKTNVTVNSTSYYDAVKQDVFSSSASVNRDVVEVWYLDPADNINKRVAQVETNCGNLTASSFLPKPGWSIQPIASVFGGVTQVTVGTNIKWEHTVKNSGPEKTDVAISFKWEDVSPFNSGSTDTIGSSTPAGLLDDASSGIYYSNYIAKLSDANKYVCRVTYASPRSKVNGVINNSRITSDKACVYVTNNPDPCRPIKFTTSVPRTTVHSDEDTDVVVTATNNTTGETKRYPSSGGYGISTIIDITTDCTTGDVWTIHESLLNGRGSSDHTYTYWHRDVPRSSCGGTPVTCTYWTEHIDYTKDFSTTKNIGPCYDYVLSAAMNSFGWVKLEPGESRTISPSVTNKPYTKETGLIVNGTNFWNQYGTKTHSKPTKWQITKMVIPPNGALPASVSAGTAGNQSYNPCDRFDPTHITTCTVAASNSSTIFDVSGSPSPSTDFPFTVPDDPAGTKICFAFSLYPSSSDPSNITSSWNVANVWYHAAFSQANNCIIIVKKPKVQIWGGDIWTKGAINTSTSVKSGYIFGSWVEYGAFAPGAITGIGTGSAFSGTAGLSWSGNSCTYNTLTFTNGGTTTCNHSSTKGSYTNLHTIPDVEASFPGTGNVITDSSVTVNLLHN